jgi:hypothetical protein
MFEVFVKMSNALHIITLDNEKVPRRFLANTTTKTASAVVHKLKRLVFDVDERDVLVRLQQLRNLNGSIARRANGEDECTGNSGEGGSKARPCWMTQPC